MNSAATIDIQTPSIPQIIGRSITAATRKTTVRKNDIIAEVTPSLRAGEKSRTEDRITHKKEGNSKNAESRDGERHQPIVVTHEHGSKRKSEGFRRLRIQDT